MDTPPTISFDEWLIELRHLASMRELDWLLGCDDSSFRAVYERGVSPWEELDQLDKMAVWRGCGCGGG
ncbi:hypothetical protein [Aquisediminimonas sediminicola]|uniref:hypothetical protein n=1 Tax=Alteraquisediminimonas sediminicola TaxID=2676787 RepID=UPI001C8F140B|nr:hypothetical protein [Aquisediminimonas sediminicola]